MCALDPEIRKDITRRGKTPDNILFRNSGHKGLSKGLHARFSAQKVNSLRVNLKKESRVISADAEVFDKVYHSFIKAQLTGSKLELLPFPDKHFHQKACSEHHAECKVEIRNKRRCLPHARSVLALELLASAVKREEEMKDPKTGREEECSLSEVA